MQRRFWLNTQENTKTYKNILSRRLWVSGYTNILETVRSKNMDSTLFALRWGAVGRPISTTLNTVDFPRLYSASAQASLVSTPTVLLAQQHIHPALCPLCGLPTVAENRNKRRVILIQRSFGILYVLIQANIWRDNTKTNPEGTFTTLGIKWSLCEPIKVCPVNLTGWTLLLWRCTALGITALLETGRTF